MPRLKSDRIHIWLETEVKNLLVQNANDLGYNSLSMYLIKCGLQEHHEDEILKEISNKLSRTLGLLNQTVKRINEGKAEAKSLPRVLDLAAQINADFEEIPNRYRKSRAGESTSRSAAKRLATEAPKKRMNPAEIFLASLSQALDVLAKIDAGEYTFRPGQWSFELASTFNRSIISVASNGKYLTQVAPHLKSIKKLGLFALSLVEDKIGTPEHQAEWHDFTVSALDLVKEIEALPPQ